VQVAFDKSFTGFKTLLFQEHLKDCYPFVIRLSGFTRLSDSTCADNAELVWDLVETSFCIRFVTMPVPLEPELEQPGQISFASRKPVLRMARDLLSEHRAALVQPF
jgi:hypothetical protein